MMFSARAFPSHPLLGLPVLSIMDLDCFVRPAAFARADGRAAAADAGRRRPVWSRPMRGRAVPIVRDAEIEALVRDYARPIFKAAGLSKSGIDIILVNDPRFNAFVAGRRMFINTGALLQAETPNEIIGVIAHEAGHIAGGHQDRLREQLARAQTMAVVASLLGIGAMVAGAPTDAGGLAQAGAGVAAGGAEAARRGLLGYQRSEEATADRSAIKYLEATGPVGQGHARHLPAFPERAVAFRRQGRPVSAKPPDAARPHRQPRRRW